MSDAKSPKFVEWPLCVFHLYQTLNYLRGFGFGIEVREFLNVKFPITVIIKLLEEPKDLSGGEVEGRPLQNLTGLI